MSSLLSDYMDQCDTDPNESVRSLPQTFAMPGWTTEPMTGDTTVTPPMLPVPAPGRAPTRVFTLPDPVVGGYAEIAAPDGRTVDQGFSTHGSVNDLNAKGGHASFMGQGHYDMVPTWNTEQAQGNGTPNKHGIALRQGIITQLFGYNAPSETSALTYVAALTGTRDTMNGIGDLG